MSPLSLEFGNVVLGSTASIPVTITNLTAGTLTPNFAGGAPNDPDQFGGSQNCAGVPLAPGASCEFTYTFSPNVVGPADSMTTIGIDSDNVALTMRGCGIVMGGSC